MTKNQLGLSMVILGDKEQFEANSSLCLSNPPSKNDLKIVKKNYTKFRPKIALVGKGLVLKGSRSLLFIKIPEFNNQSKQP